MFASSEGMCVPEHLMSLVHSQEATIGLPAKRHSNGVSLAGLIVICDCMLTELFVVTDIV